MTPDWYYAKIRINPVTRDIYESLSAEASPAGKLWLDTAKYFKQNDWSARDGVWTTPWPMKVEPTNRMVAYDTSFNETFSDITDRRGLEIKAWINAGKKVALFYSGGIDSTVCLVSLLKCLSGEEQKCLAIVTNSVGAYENPLMFDRIQAHGLLTIDANRNSYDVLCDHGYMPITGDCGDSVFGTELGTQFIMNYPRLAKMLPTDLCRQMMVWYPNLVLDNRPYTDFEQLICMHLAKGTNDPIGPYLYQKIHRNIESSDVPVVTVCDFFWWIIFNLREMECALRGVMLYYRKPDRKEAIQEKIINWFGTDDYQRWAMTNNNNRQKIANNSPASYKMAARQYIYDYDHNDWYFKHKLKIGSFQHVLKNNHDVANERLFCMDTDYNLHFIDDIVVQNVAKEKLSLFQG